MTQSEAADKIRKLLNTSGRTDAEADTARTLAEALAYKFEVDLASIRDTLGQRDAITHRVLGGWSKIPAEARHASRIVRQYFDVLVVTHEGYECKIFAAGTLSQLDVAEYVFRFVVDEFRRQWNHKRGRCRKLADFMEGLFAGLDAKLWIEAAKRLQSGPVGDFDRRKALVLDQSAAQKEYFERTFGTEITTTQVNDHSGKVEAADVQVGPTGRHAWSHHCRQSRHPRQDRGRTPWLNHVRHQNQVPPRRRR